MGRKAANHTAMCVPMQQSCVFFTCTPHAITKRRNLKCSNKKKKKRKKKKTKEENLAICGKLDESGEHYDK